ncbi:response regulator [Mycobacteroides salmoniphilum]|uniref:Putative response regulatory protein n=1 Tax=Mycobacteroides salmoniphilum TaxID=404941 RepID=A0A4R8SUN4_9MYCO|nr:response regulator [Mycobacteroides salmoniphilum]TDZ89582.1 putative response regulatory protein [Mycobacteroides salmoniphilum]TEA04164.1 putative response regulatory protein [Mycobacteroides salmoniphilum]
MALQVLVYSDDITVRRKVIEGIGTRPDSALPPLEFVEVATGPMVIERLAAGGIDLAILDGEATPFGGMGVAKQVKDEVDAPPPIVVLTGRPQDSWLANWSRAEGVVPRPIDPMRLTATVIELLGSAAATHR